MWDNQPVLAYNRAEEALRLPRRRRSDTLDLCVDSCANTEELLLQMTHLQINYHYECIFVYRSLIKFNLTSDAMSLETPLLFIDARDVIHPFGGKVV